MGTPTFALPSLEAALGSPCDLVLVVTRPDRQQGRGRRLASSPVGTLAAGRGLPAIKPENVNATEPLEQLRSLRPDLFVVVAFGSILSRELLSIPALGSLNVHASLLPRYRGASPVARALWDGCSVTGVTTIWMDEGIDTGDVALQRAVPIPPEDDAESLGERLAHSGAALLAETLSLAAQDAAPRTPQPSQGASYARKLAAEDARVQWALDAVAVWHRQRAVTPKPGAHTSYQERQLLLERTEPWHTLPVREEPGTVLKTGAGVGVVVACAPGALRLITVRPQDRRSMPAEDWARGARVREGDRLGLPGRVEAR